MIWLRRLALFARRAFEELLTRVEGQAATRRQRTKKAKKQDEATRQEAASKRARQQTAKGAYC